jgi:hypothetical protein
MEDPRTTEFNKRKGERKNINLLRKTQPRKIGVNADSVTVINQRVSLFQTKPQHGACRKW